MMIGLSSGRSIQLLSDSYWMREPPESRFQACIVLTLNPPQQAAAKKCERGQIRALCTLNVLPPQVILRSDPFPVLKILVKISVSRAKLTEEFRYLLKPSIISDLASSGAVDVMIDDMCTLYRVSLAFEESSGSSGYGR